MTAERADRVALFCFAITRLRICLRDIAQDCEDSEVSQRLRNATNLILWASSRMQMVDFWK